MAAAFVVRKRVWKRVFLILGVVIFLIFSSPALYNAFARWWQPKPVHLTKEKKYSFGIVAGGFGSVGADGEGYFNSASDRFLQTVKLYKTGVIEKILISGGNSRDNNKGFREAEWARKEMLDFGVPDSVIFVEDKSSNTADNARNSKRLLDSLGASQPYVLITSAFHMPRARRLYKKAGMKIVPFPCNYTEGRGPVKAAEFLPSFQTLTGWPKYLKEVAGVVYHSTFTPVGVRSAD